MLGCQVGGLWNDYCACQLEHLSSENMTFKRSCHIFSQYTFLVAQLAFVIFRPLPFGLKSHMPALFKFVSFWENCALGSSHCQTVLYIYMFIFSWDVVKLLFDLFLSCYFFNSSYSNWFEFSGVKWLSDHALKAMLRPWSERKPASKHHDTVTFQCDVLCPTSLIFSIVFGPLNSCILFVWHNLRQCNSYIYICT